MTMSPQDERRDGKEEEEEEGVEGVAPQRDDSDEDYDDAADDDDDDNDDDDDDEDDDDEDADEDDDARYQPTSFKSSVHTILPVSGDVHLYPPRAPRLMAVRRSFSVPVRKAVSMASAVSVRRAKANS